jgi:hypothetical protein
MDGTRTSWRYSKMVHAVRVRDTSLRTVPGATDDVVRFDGLERMSTGVPGSVVGLMERDTRERAVA